MVGTWRKDARWLAASVAALAAALAGATEPDAPRPAPTVAVLPIESLVAVRAPLGEIRRGLIERLSLRGVQPFDDERLAELLARHRLRYTGGVNAEMAQALRAEGVDGILVTSLDLYDEALPPRFGCIARLISTTDPPTMLWIGAAARSGEDSPGLLGMGLELDPVVLRDDVLVGLSDAVAEAAGGEPGPRARPAGETSGGAKRSKLRPQHAFRSPDLGQGAPVRRVAVLPFDNGSRRAYGGEIVALQLTRALAVRGRVEVVEPGLVREALLEARLIFGEGAPSLPQIDLLHSLLDVDLVLGGRVGEYLDLGGEWADPQVQYTVQAIDTRTREIVWTSVATHHGAGGVVFFDLGRIRTAHALAAGMADQVARELLGAGSAATPGGTTP